MNIGTGHLEIHRLLTVNDDRFIAALEKMAEYFVAAIVSLGVSALQPFHPGDQVSLGCLDKQMVMITHEHIGMDAPAGPLAGFLQSFQEAFAILDIGKDRLSPTTACHDMI